MQLYEYEELYRHRVEQFRVKHPDFDKVLNRDDIPLDVHLQLELKAHHAGPAIAYWLGKHPETARRVIGMDATSALRKILSEMRKADFQ